VKLRGAADEDMVLGLDRPVEMKTA
jgi:hypothetical protein